MQLFKQGKDNKCAIWNPESMFVFVCVGVCLQEQNESMWLAAHHSVHFFILHSVTSRERFSQPAAQMKQPSATVEWKAWRVLWSGEGSESRAFFPFHVSVESFSNESIKKQR